MKNELSADQLLDLLDNISDGLFIVDVDWTVTFVNDFALDFWGLERDELVGENLWEIFPEAIGRSLHEKMTEAAEQSVSVEFEARSLTGRWIRLHQHPVDSGQFVYFEDVTDHRRTAARLETKYDVTRILADSESLEEAAAPIIDIICSGLEASCGSLWVPEGRNGQLTCIEHRGEQDPDVSSTFSQRTLEMTFRRGEGLPGETWERTQAFWIPDVSERDNFIRAPQAAEVGVTSGFGFPVVVGDEFFGVMEFFTPERIELSDPMLEMMESIGREIGQFIQRWRAEHDVVETSQRYRAVLESALDLIISMDEHGRIIEFNSAAQETFGYDREEVIGEYLADCIIPPDLRDDHWKGLSMFLETGESTIIDRRIEMPALHADGSTFPVELTVTRQTLNGESFFTGYLRDLTEQKRAERKRRAVEERFRAVAEHFADVIAIIDTDTRIQYVSPASEELLGLSPDALNGDELTDLLSSEETHTLRNEITRTIYETDEVTSFTVPYLHPDGGRRHLSFKAKSLLDNPGIEGVLLNVREVTAAKRYEKQLVEAKQEAEEMSRLKSTLLANMSHEIRTPLSSLLGWIDVLKRDAPEADPQTIETIERGAHRLSDTLDSVLALAQLEGRELEPDFEQISICRQIDQIAGEFKPKANQKGLELRTYCEISDMVVAVDRTFLNRILDNLVGNAVKFTDEGTVSINALEDGNRVTIRVRDTGPGISEEFLPDIFSEFEQESTGYDRSHEGAGLGLTITKRLVEAMNGSISVSSAKGRGTTFSVELPRSADQFDGEGPEERPVPADSEPASENESVKPVPDLEEISDSLGRILVVEDQDDIRKLIVRALSEATSVEGFADAEAAVERAEEETFDLVLMDISLPGMDGIEATHHLREVDKYGDIPILAITGHAMPGDREKFLDEGFDGYLAKPFTLEMLTNTVRRELPRAS